ncbi:MAG: class I SAM-dependent methyltransferase, partial [Acidobacteriota bacterium]|nr:class I SAM-dependent methyltransferase [Acidobacteriota bacterium]
MVWLDSPPAPADMGRHYGSYYDEIITGAGENDTKRWLQRRETLRRYKQSGALLDLGCSSGSFLSSLKGDPWELHGIEMSSGPARKAEARSGAKVFVGDILEAPFAAQSFDAVTCFDVFEHLYRPHEVLQMVRYWLKPGGIFYALMPNIYSAEARVFGSYWYGLELPRHLSHFSPKSLRHLAARCGFRDVFITTSRGRLVEYSTRYLFDDLCHTAGVHRPPLAETKAPSLAWKIARKAYRLSMLPVICALISLAGKGEIVQM